MKFIGITLVSLTGLFAIVSASATDSSRLLSVMNNKNSVSSLKKHDVAYLQSLAKYLSIDNSKKYTKEQYDEVMNQFYSNSNRMRRLEAEVMQNEHEHRRLAASDEECGIFLAASLAESMWDCFSLGNDVMSLVNENDCQTSYDFEATKMKRICGNKCYNKLTDVLKVMSEAQCSASILKQSCSECAENEQCVGGECLKKCSVDLPCDCNDVCQQGTCQPPEDEKVEQANLGINGYKKSMEYLCYQDPATDAFCMSELFTVMNTADVATFCDELKPIGCCTGTILNWATSCALTSDTIMTEAGPISKADLKAFCPDVDFDTSCSTAPALEEGECEEGFFLSPASTLKTSTLPLYIVGTLASFMILCNFLM
jgi:hypothetical protein